jgi:hypothetical protein
MRTGKNKMEQNEKNMKTNKMKTKQNETMKQNDTKD